MKKSNFITILLVLLLLSLGSLIYKYTKVGQKNLQTLSQISQTKSQPAVTINDTRIPVEIADSQDEWQRGLSYRDSLPADSGLLFIFDKKDIKIPFWMKEMKFSIDIIWINDSTIIQIDKNLPYPEANTPDSKLPVYIPKESIDYVLEVNAGFADRQNIKVGDSIKMSI